jgi:prepilin-type N-terminal cleavage/methylation domain-containing protein
MKNIKIRNQKGFTLVEIAIVLVIIGLLIGGILKGQSMIRNARVKSLVNDMENLKAAIYTYQDRYGMLPGDENDPNSPPNDTFDGNNNGLLNEADGREMEDLRLAGIIPGTGITLPTHRFGGTLRVDRIVIGGSQNINQVVATNIPGEICQEIDTRYDDGVYNTGDIRGNAAYTSTNVGLFGWAL